MNMNPTTQEGVESADNVSLIDARAPRTNQFLASSLVIVACLVHGPALLLVTSAMRARSTSGRG
jgi:hypothetical protein